MSLPSTKLYVYILPTEEPWDDLIALCYSLKSSTKVGQRTQLPIHIVCKRHHVKVSAMSVTKSHDQYYWKVRQYVNTSFFLHQEIWVKTQKRLLPHGSPVTNCSSQHSSTPPETSLCFRHLSEELWGRCARRGLILPKAIVTGPGIS